MYTTVKFNDVWQCIVYSYSGALCEMLSHTVIFFASGPGIHSSKIGYFSNRSKISKRRFEEILCEH